MKTDIVQIEVDLLLLKYGEKTVIKALSVATSTTEDELNKKIRELKEKKIKASKKPRQQRQPLDIAKEVIAGSSNESLLTDLAILYQNKQFLPQLKDVKRFLGRFNITKTTKTRNEATRLVFESLSQCTADELINLSKDLNTNNQSSFAKLAEHIMGDGNNKPSNK